MLSKTFKISLIFCLLVFIFGISSLVLATNETNEKVKVIRLDENLVTEEINFRELARDRIRAGFKRVIADQIDERTIELMETRGCLLKHRLRQAASFECPEAIIPELKVREARVFHILDLKADQQIKADKVWQEGIKGVGVKVVILDTGIDESHIELSDSLLGQKDFVDNDDLAEDPHGHGTHVAGIITANGIYQIDSNYATGVAPEAGIYMLRVCNASGACYEDDMMAAMEYAVNNLTGARVMNISLGGGNFGSHCDFDPLAAKVNWVADHGWIVTVAAGNEGKGVSTPACASKAIAVGVVDATNIVPYWSNRGSALDIVAPGVSILSTYSCLAQKDCSVYWYAWMSGTSMAAPHVAGVSALLLQTKPEATTEEIKNALYTTADPVNKCYACSIWQGSSCLRQKEVACTPEITGAGVVNAYGAYLAIKPTEPIPTPTPSPTPTPTPTSTPTPTPAPEVMCWSGSYQYLYQNSNQAKKFCKCAQGTYGYKSYKYEWSKQITYQYVDTGNNENWNVTSKSSNLPIYQVTCTDDLPYLTNQNYSWPK